MRKAVTSLTGCIGTWVGCVRTPPMYRARLTDVCDLQTKFVLPRFMHDAHEIIRQVIMEGRTDHPITDEFVAVAVPRAARRIRGSHRNARERAGRQRDQAKVAVVCKSGVGFEHLRSVG